MFPLLCFGALQTDATFSFSLCRAAGNVQRETGAGRASREAEAKATPPSESFAAGEWFPVVPKGSKALSRLGMCSIADACCSFLLGRAGSTGSRLYAGRPYPLLLLLCVDPNEARAFGNSTVFNEWPYQGKRARLKRKESKNCKEEEETTQSIKFQIQVKSC